MTRHTGWLSEAGWMGWLAVAVIIIGAFAIQWMIKHQRQLSPLVPTGLLGFIFAIGLLLIHLDPNLFRIQATTWPIYAGVWAFVTGGAYLYLRHKMR